MKAAELANTIQWGRHLSRMTPQEADTIIKCVRFAADMEKLTSVATVRFQVTRTQEVACICSMWNDNREIRGEGSDIYTAARKAVEALEEKR